MIDVVRCSSPAPETLSSSTEGSADGLRIGLVKGDSGRA